MIEGSINGAICTYKSSFRQEEVKEKMISWWNENYTGIATDEEFKTFIALLNNSDLLIKMANYFLVSYLSNRVPNVLNLLREGTLYDDLIEVTKRVNELICSKDINLIRDKVIKSLGEERYL